MLKEELHRLAKERQIDLIGFTDALPVRCRDWDYDADPAHYSPCRCAKTDAMTYAPRKILPTAETVIVVGMYMYGFDRLTPSVPGTPRGNIGPWTRAYVEAGRYATDTVADYLTERGYRAEFTNSLPYRTLAVKAGLGRIGNNGFLYHEGMGCYIRLGCVLTDAKIEPDEPERAGNSCGSCTICRDACPTGARAENGCFDADRCLHLWLQGQGCHGDFIPAEERHMCLNYLMRTGRCLEVCPRNRNLRPRESFPFSAEDKPDSPELIPLVLADEDEIRRRLPYHVYKYGIDNIRKNAIIALGNLKDPASREVLEQGMCSLDAQMRALCVWALGEMGFVSALRKRADMETSELVLQEIEAALIKHDNEKRLNQNG